MGDVVNDFWLEWLPVDIENSVAVNVKPKHVTAVDWTALLSVKTSSLSDVGHDPRPFGFSLVKVLAVPRIDWSIAVVPWVALGLGTRVCPWFLDTHDVHLLSSGRVQYCGMGRHTFASVCPADLQISVLTKLSIAAGAAVPSLAS